MMTTTTTMMMMVVVRSSSSYTQDRSSGSEDVSAVCEKELEELERRMDCRVCVPAKAGAVWNHVPRPIESYLYYDQAPPLHPNVGWADFLEYYQQKIQGQFGTKRQWKQRSAVGGARRRPKLPLEFVLIDHVKALQHALTELGPLCALYLAQTMNEEIMKKLNLNGDSKEEKAATSGGSLDYSMLYQFIEKECVGHLAFVLTKRAELKIEMVTPKIKALTRKLCTYSQSVDFRAIVFVDRRHAWFIPPFLLLQCSPVPHLPLWRQTCSQGAGLLF